MIGTKPGRQSRNIQGNAPKIEAGEMSPSIGLVFEVAALVGVTLFGQDKQLLATHLDLTQSKIPLLPKRIRKKKTAVDDDF